MNSLNQPKSGTRCTRWGYHQKPPSQPGTEDRAE